MFGRLNRLDGLQVRLRVRRRNASRGIAPRTNARRPDRALDYLLRA